MSYGQLTIISMLSMVEITLLMICTFNFIKLLRSKLIYTYLTMPIKECYFSILLIIKVWIDWLRVFCNLAKCSLRMKLRSLLAKTVVKSNYLWTDFVSLIVFSSGHFEIQLGKNLRRIGWLDQSTHLKKKNFSLNLCLILPTLKTFPS